MKFKDRNNSSDYKARLVQRKSSDEHKKTLWEKALSQKKEHKQNDNDVNINTSEKDKESQTPTWLRPLLIDKKTIDAADKLNHFNSLDDLDQSESEVSLCQAYTDLVSIMIQMIQARGICLAFSWPNGFEWPGIAHALANRVNSLLTNYEKKGIRLALYPSNRATYIRYKKTFFPSSIFLDEARMHANFKKELSKRDHAFMTLNPLHDEDGNMKIIPIRAAIPLFEWSNVSGYWRKIGDQYFKEIRSALRWVGNTSRQDKIDEYAKLQDDPEFSEDGIFLIGRKCPSLVVRSVLTDEKNKFDLIVIDARQIMLRNINNWRKNISKVVEYVCSSEVSPSLLILNDDPVIYSELQYLIQEFVKKKISKIKNLNLYHIIREDRSVWKSDNNAPISILQNNPDIIVHVTGKRSLDKIQFINKCAKSLGEEHPEGKKLIFQMGGFLRGLIDIPIGQKGIREWVKEFTADCSAIESSRFSARYTWYSYKLNLQENLSSLSIADNFLVRKAIDAADDVADEIELYTEIQKNIEDVANNAWLTKSRLLIIVPYSNHIEPLKWQLSNIFGDEYKTIIDICAQADTIEYNLYKSVAIAGRVDKMLPKLLLSCDFPDKLYINSSAYGALRIVRALKQFMTMTEFSKIHPRAQVLLQEIQPILSSMGNIGVEFAENSYENNFSYRDDYSYEPSKTYAELYLKGYGVYPVGKNQILIKYINSNPVSYRAVRIEDINEGDQILLLEDALRERIENYLSKTGKEIEKNSAAILALYFSIAKTNLQTYYNFGSRTTRAQEIHNKMNEINPEIAGLIAVQSVSRWIMGIEEYDNCSKEGFQTYSAQKIQHFLVFAEALYIDNYDAQMYFNRGVRKYRSSRILEGRYVGNRLKEILTNASRPESIGLSIDQRNILFNMALENVYMVEAIYYLDEEDEV